ncbi:hypothetical protein FJP69_03375 [Stenotrophomonas maltophilia]|nr:hypothetical protein FJP69_03375 [Stenotrophomonas maltophilia]
MVVPAAGRQLHGASCVHEVAGQRPALPTCVPGRWGQSPLPLAKGSDPVCAGGRGGVNRGQ